MGGAALAAVLFAGTSSGSAAGWVWSSFSGWMTCPLCVPDQKSQTFYNPTETVTSRTLWRQSPSDSSRFIGVGTFKPWTNSQSPTTTVAAQVELDCTNGGKTFTSYYSRQDWDEEWTDDNVNCNSGGFLRRSRIRVGRIE